MEKVKTWIKNHFAVGKYSDQFQIGISATIHYSHEREYYIEGGKNHFHLWIDLGFWYIEITINDERY